MQQNRGGLYSKAGVAAAVMALCACAVTAQAGAVDSNCSFNGIALKGKVQIVDSFPDFKVKKVSSFPDLQVQWVSAFPSDCGQWQQVNSFPDFKIQFVNSFPDFTIQEVSSFPGVR